MGFEPPQRLVRTLGETYGEAVAAEWLGKLPELAGRVLDHASLETERVMAPGGRSSLVVLVRRPDGSPAALKIAPPFALPDRERRRSRTGTAGARSSSSTSRKRARSS